MTGETLRDIRLPKTMYWALGARLMARIIPVFHFEFEGFSDRRSLSELTHLVHFRILSNLKASALYPDFRHPNAIYQHFSKVAEIQRLSVHRCKLESQIVCQLSKLLYARNPKSHLMQVLGLLKQPIPKHPTEIDRAPFFTSIIEETIADITLAKSLLVEHQSKDQAVFQLMRHKVWSIEPDWFASIFRAYHSDLNGIGSDWGGWIEWYGLVLNPQKKDWILQDHNRLAFKKIYKKVDLELAFIDPKSTNSFTVNQIALKILTEADWERDWYDRKCPSGPKWLMSQTLKLLKNDPLPTTSSRIYSSLQASSNDDFEPEDVFESLLTLEEIGLVERSELNYFTISHGESLNNNINKDRVQPLENVFSPLEFGWNDDGLLSVVNQHTDLSLISRDLQKDRNLRLDAAAILAKNICKNLTSNKYNARQEYTHYLLEYVKYLPRHDESGNIYLADAAARSVRTLFQADAESLSIGLASQLKTLLEQHIGLRAYFPQIVAFYDDVKTGTLNKPLPIDAVEKVISVIDENTPTVFDDTVRKSIQATANPFPEISPTVTEAKQSSITSEGTITAPPDPLGQIEPHMASNKQTAGAINRLYKVFLEGEKISKAGGAWQKVYKSIEPHIGSIIDFLKG